MLVKKYQLKTFRKQWKEFVITQRFTPSYTRLTKWVHDAKYVLVYLIICLHFKILVVKWLYISFRDFISKKKISPSILLLTPQKNRVLYSTTSCSEVNYYNIKVVHLLVLISDGIYVYLKEHKTYLLCKKSRQGHGRKTRIYINITMFLYIPYPLIKDIKNVPFTEVCMFYSSDLFIPGLRCVSEYLN